ncbi:MAG: hypothetical protein BMS9Abin12_0433 [Acidimicrobiia bacterium]|nr:MAG: hypothetical protein BMS9Abin12_0433 [Acidimicrobiia bacterium]
MLLALIVQIGFLALARNVAATSAEAGLRKGVIADLDVETVRVGLVRDLSAVVPGAEDISVEVTDDATVLRAVVSFRWVPPGPDFVPITVVIERTAVRVVPP